jgi:hypothetical protein
MGSCVTKTLEPLLPSLRSACADIGKAVYFKNRLLLKLVEEV